MDDKPASTRDVIVRTVHLAAAVRFYESTLGFPVAMREPGLVGFETGAFRLYVESGQDHAPVFELLVRDVAAKKAELMAAGCTLIEEDPALPRCYLRDPFGFTFNLGAARA